MLKHSVNNAYSVPRHHILVEEAPKTVGDRIRTCRESKNLDLKPLAKAAGISISALSQIETGTTKQPKPETLFAIADALGVSARFLVFGHNGSVAATLTGIELSDTSRFRLRRLGRNK